MTTTWRYKRGAVMFHLTMPSGGAPVAAIRRAAAALFAHAPGVAAVTLLEVSTRSRGEYALRWTDGLDGERVAHRLAEIADLTGLEASCALHCADGDGRALVIPEGLSFWSQLAELTAPPEQPIELTLALHSDVYLATSWGEDRDNRVLAAINAPRFNEFLARLVRDTGATVTSVSADDYAGQVDVTGIRGAGAAAATTTG